MTRIECRVTVRMPGDANGVTPEPGSHVIVDDEDERVQRWMNFGYLVPILATPMPDELLTADARAAKRKGAKPDGADAAP